MRPESLIFRKFLKITILNNPKYSGNKPIYFNLKAIVPEVIKTEKKVAKSAPIENGIVEETKLKKFKWRETKFTLEKFNIG